MKKHLLFVFLLFIFHSVHAATPFQVRRDDVKVFTSPDFKHEVPSATYFYGDTLSVNVYNGHWAEITLQDGSRGYVKQKNLLPATGGFGKLSDKEKIATKLYNITSATIVFRKPGGGSRVPLQFKQHQILYDAVPVDEEWMSIPIGGGEKGYVETRYLNEIPHEDKVAMFGQPSGPIADNSTEVAGANDYLDGIRTGKKFVVIIVAVCGLLLLLTFYRINRGPLRGKALGLYLNTSLLLAILEIWYFYSTGMNGVFWFLSFDHILRTILYVAVLIVFTWIQLSAGLNLLDDTIKVSARKKKKYLWIAIGIAAGIALSYICRESVGIRTEAHRFGPDTVVCQILGQLPAGILFARNLKKRLQTKKILFCIYYMVIAGTIVSLIMGSILIFIVFAVFFALAAARPQQADSEEPQINPACYTCKFFSVTYESCALDNDVRASSCSDARD